MTKPFEVDLQLPVRTYDIDFAGIVSNIVYVRWLEDLRCEMLARHFPLEAQFQAGISPIVLQTKIDYKQSIVFNDEPTGKMWIEALEGLRWRVNAEIFVKDKLSAIGEQMGIFVNIDTKKPVKMPESIANKYHNW
jgi:acyl-CoA thioester hydrolase